MNDEVLTATHVTAARNGWWEVSSEGESAQVTTVPGLPAAPIVVVGDDVSFYLDPNAVTVVIGDVSYAPIPQRPRLASVA